MLARPKFGLSDEVVQRVLAAVSATAEMVEATTRLSVIVDDPADDKFLALAIDGRADLIVSGDRHLLKLGTFRGVPIVRPADVP